MCVPGCQEAVHRALSRRQLVTASIAAGVAAAAVPQRASAAPTRSFSNVVDLTHTMSADFPTFFGVPGIEMEQKFEFKKDGFNLYWWHIIEHAGTHLDAPIHFSADGISAERLDVSTLIAPLAVVDVSARAAENPDYLLTRDDLIAWEKRHGVLPESCCVAMHSGWATRIGEPGKFTGKDAAGVFHFPGFSPEAAEWLVTERKAIGLAVDTLSLDHGPSKDFKVHYAWLPTGRWGLENVANLDKVPPAGATIVVGLAKVKGATGGPARLMALV